MIWNSHSQDEKWQWCLAETNKTDLQKSAKALLFVGLFRIPHRFFMKVAERRKTWKASPMASNQLKVGLTQFLMKMELLEVEIYRNRFPQKNMV